MKPRKLLLFAALFLAQMLAAQSVDSLMQRIRALPDHPEKIAAARQRLREAFADGDLGMTNAWLGFLQTELDTTDYAATLADERWLLYFWTENFSLLFAEVADYQSSYLRRTIYQNPPPDDGLFRMVDQTSFDHRHELYAAIQRGFLSEEERAFGVLLLDFLLRADATEDGEREKNAKAAAFLKKWPKSRFTDYVWEQIYSETRPDKSGFSGDLLVEHGRHNGAMGINFGPLWSIGGSLGIWSHRMTYSLRGQIGEQKVRRQFREGSYFIAPDTAATMVNFDFGAAYDLVNTRRLRLAPELGVGWAGLRVIDRDDITELSFSTLYWSAALNVDWKFAHNANAKDGMAWSAVRVRAGYKHFNFGNDNSELGGSQIFVGIGASFFVRGASKQKP